MNRDGRLTMTEVVPVGTLCDRVVKTGEDKLGGGFGTDRETLWMVRCPTKSQQPSNAGELKLRTEEATRERSESFRIPGAKSSSMGANATDETVTRLAVIQNRCGGA